MSYFRRLFLQQNHKICNTHHSPSPSYTLISSSNLSTSAPRMSTTCSPCSNKNFSTSATELNDCRSWKR